MQQGILFSYGTLQQKICPCLAGSQDGREFKHDIRWSLITIASIELSQSIKPPTKAGKRYCSLLLYVRENSVSCRLYHVLFFSLQLMQNNTQPGPQKTDVSGNTAITFFFKEKRNACTKLAQSQTFVQIYTRNSITVQQKCNNVQHQY